MNERLFFASAEDSDMDDQFTDPAPNLPPFLLIEIEDLQEFVDHVNSLEHFGIDVDVAVAELLDQINRDSDALINLVVSGEDMLDGFIDEQMAQEIYNYARARQSLGTAIVQRCRQLKVYYKGTLYYQYKGIVGTRLVLQKLMIPLTNQKKNERALARQADLAHRRYTPRLPAAPEVARDDRQQLEAALRSFAAGVDRIRGQTGDPGAPRPQ